MPPGRTCPLIDLHFFPSPAKRTWLSRCCRLGVSAVRILGCIKLSVVPESTSADVAWPLMVIGIDVLEAPGL
jgi:hypothetical protein